MKKNKTSKAWIHEHINDPYVLRAKAEGWRSRAVFKLMEIDDRDHLLKPGLTVVELGAAPGSWSQLVARRIQPGGHLYAIDMIEVAPLLGMEFIQGDFREDEVLHELETRLAGRRVDLVLSDMAPNLSGVQDADQARALHLAELSLEFAQQHLKLGGDLLVKVFQGAGTMELRTALAKSFETVQIRKPSASRGRSAENFLLARRLNRL